MREAMHSVFLYHAIKAGMNMGIVNPTMLEVYDEIPKDLLELIEDVMLDRRDDATERLLDFSERVKSVRKEKTEDLAWREQPLQDRITHALVKGIDRFIEEDIEEARQQAKRPLDVIEESDDRNGSCRRFVWQRKNVPAAGCKICPCNEEGCGIFTTLY